MRASRRACGPPQHEGSLTCIGTVPGEGDLLILRRPRRGRLEGRTSSIQACLQQHLERIRLTPLLALFLLSACGFQPLYAEGPISPSDDLAAIDVAVIPNRAGQKLRTQLQIAFNARAEDVPTLYSLDVDLSSNYEDVVIRKDETASRQSVTVVADYLLRSLETGAVVTRGRVRSVNSYNVASSDFATQTAAEDAVDGSLRQIALAIQTQLAIFFRRQEQAHAPAGQGTG